MLLGLIAVALVFGIQRRRVGRGAPVGAVVALGLVILALLLMHYFSIGAAVALLLWALVAIWVLYRVIKGVIYFKDQRPIPV